MMKIEKLTGTESRLYELVAPLVMSPNVLRQNNNYPFKTSRNHVWFIACDERWVYGFVPVELRTQQAIINNYYVRGDDTLLLSSLIKEVLKAFDRECKITSVTLSRHVSVFKENGFRSVREWKQYVKMEKSNEDGKKRL
ncbi:hypothetical protein IE90_03140 [Sanguibacteroides justesenii]|uniref:N-acetyltransferase domain-containing protein n=2 Tax=Bacteroidales TaxID=171549 RepID=A0A0C3RHC1_9PORP|nr:hypothetical protein BA92_01640 [Sanguibacteroides justesenii]KIO47020.1 hypothetical protein IE90_03140 [Sanguibacteroides justesenii]